MRKPTWDAVLSVECVDDAIEPDADVVAGPLDRRELSVDGQRVAAEVRTAVRGRSVSSVTLWPAASRMRAEQALGDAGATGLGLHPRGAV
jgi:hypothetical protein